MKKDILVVRIKELREAIHDLYHAEVCALKQAELAMKCDCGLDKAMDMVDDLYEKIVKD